MKIATVLASFGALALLAPAATAQPVTSPSETAGVEANALGVEVLDPEGLLDNDRIRAAIGGELGIRIVDATSFAPELGRMEIAIDQGEVRIAFHPAAGTVIERTLALPPRAEDRLSLIAFVATNLVRDQASEVIASLPEIPPPAVERRTSVAPDQAPVRHMPFSIGLVYPLSLDRIRGERVDVGVGLYGIAGYAESSSVASVSGVVDVKVRRASGAQLAGVAALAGSVDGAQIAGVGAYSGGAMNGLQMAGVASTSRGGVNGAQISGVANVAKSVYGLQLAGVANVAGDVHGVQLGVVNVARKMHGVQLGVVNISEDSDDAIPIGLINYSRNGQLAVDGAVDSSRLSTLSVRHGTKHIYNVWGVGWTPDSDHVLVGAGLGFRARVAHAVSLDVDAIHWLTNIWDNTDAILGGSQINQLRATAAVPIAKNIEVFGGVAANVYISDGMDESANFHPNNERRWELSDGDQVVMWPSAFAGVRLRAQ